MVFSADGILFWRNRGVLLPHGRKQRSMGYF